MMNKYSKQDLNQILLSKKLNEFYVAIMESRQELLTDEEYNEITRRERSISGENKEKIEDLLKKIQTDGRLKNFAPDLMRLMYSLA